MICWGTLLITLSSVAAFPARKCSGVEPVDLLGEALSEKSTLPKSVEVVTTDGIKGYRFSSQATNIGVDSSVVLGGCANLPVEFSIQINFRHQAPRNTYEYLLTLLAQDKQTVLLSVRLRRNSAVFEYIREGDRRLESVTFSSDILSDGEWHNLVISYTREEVKFTLDCEENTRKLDRPIDSRLDMRNTRFYIGSKHKKRNRFTGILRQAIFLPGADASGLICPSPYPSIATVKEKLPGGTRVGGIRTPVIFEEDQPYITCSVRHEGRFLYSDDATLKICNDGQFRHIKSSPERLDYITDYEDFVTPNKTIDIEAFHIPGKGNFIATANSGAERNTKSLIYKWTGLKYEKHQELPSKEAQQWKHFTIGDEHFLALANGGRGRRNEVPSVIFRWNPRREKFVRHQTIMTSSARSWEAFEIEGRHYLAVANYMDDNNNTKGLSKIYVWDPDARAFTDFQTLPSVGAIDIEFLKIDLPIGTYHLLMVANAFDGKTSKLNSSVFYWLLGSFLRLQDIETIGARDIESFQIDGRYFIAIANTILFDSKVSDTDREYHIPSSIYELNFFTQRFVKIQDIQTQGASDWEFFTVGVNSYLIISNLEPIADGVVRSVVFRWQGVEKFVPVHNFTSKASADFEHVAISGQHYLAMADPNFPFSKLYKIVTY